MRAPAPEALGGFCVWLALGIFVVSGLAKLVSAHGSARVLLQTDEVFGVTNQKLYLAVGTLELCVAAALVKLRSVNLRLMLVAGLSTNFLLYRAGLWLVGAPHACPCLGNAAAWTHLDPKAFDMISKGALVWLLGSSYFCLLLRARRYDARVVTSQPKTLPTAQPSTQQVRDLVLVVLAVLQVGRAAAQEFTAQGKLVHSDFLPSGLERRSEEEFTVAVSGRNWIIREQRADNGRVFYKETGFDGTNGYQVVTFPKDGRSPTAGLTIFVQASIYEWDSPAPQPMFGTAPIWLAYASGEHLAAARGGRLRPVCMPDELGLWHTGFRASATWKSNVAVPHLPEHVAYVDDGRAHPLDGRRGVVRYPAFTNVVYAAEFTYFNGVAVPRHFVVDRFVFSTTGALLVAKDEGRAESLVARCEAGSFRPGLTGTVLVSDCRLQGKYPGPQPRYIVTNGDWQIMPYDKLVQYHQGRRVPGAIQNRIATPASRSIVLLAMFVTTGAFAAMAIRVSRKERDLRRYNE